MLNASEKVDESTKKKSLFEKIAEDDLYPMLLEMGNPLRVIEKYQKQRILQSILILTFFIILGVTVLPAFYLIGVISFVYVYYAKYTNVRRMYNNWKFQRHLQFTKFTRLLIPYLKESNGNISLYSIFNRILKRTENETDRNSLYRLMSEMNDRPNDIKPFVDYAERSSGTDMSILFMSTIFDFRQSTFDIEVIDELGKLASEEMLTGVDQIITFKLSRFNMFPTKVVMTSILIVIGFALSMFIHIFSTLQF